MASLLGAAFRPKAEAPVPYVGRRAASSAFGGTGGVSGPMGRMSQVGTLFAVVDRICTGAAAPDWDLYRTPARGQDDEQRQVVEPGQHAAAKLWAEPNPHMTQADLVEAVQQHVELADTGDGFLVVVRAGKIPIELWPVRPDRMHEVPHPTKYLAGWIYKAPDGEKIPLGTDEVIQIKGTPNPTNPYRGLGRVQALVRDLDSSVAAAEWSANFFRNDATPGGIIEVPEALTDEEFDSMRDHWAEQHQGVSNAHRVAIIEHGTWKTTSYSMKDMEFSALRNLGRDQIMEAFGVSRATMGITEGVNFAAAKAADLQFAKLITVPRLERWKQALNTRLLPMFPGGTGKGVEFDYESPVGADDEADIADRDSKVRSAVALLSIPTLRFDPAATLAAFDLPDIPVEEAPEPPAPVVAPPQPPGQDPAQPDPDEAGDEPEARAVPRVTAAALTCQYCGADCSEGRSWDGGDLYACRACSDARAARNCPPDCTCGVRDSVRAEGDEPDLSELQQAWEQAVERVLDQWQDVTADQRAQLRKQIVDAVDDDDLTRLAQLSATSGDSARVLAESMEAMARTAARHVVDEAAEQGVTIPQAVPPAEELAATAATVAALLAAALALEAGREALRVHRPGMTGAQVASAVDEHLRGLSDRAQRDAAGGALTGAQNAGMRATYEAASTPGDDGLPGPVGSLYATEVLDGATCAPCRAIDGRFICTTEDLTPHDRLYTALGGYVDCLGGARCRGTTTGVWRPKTVDDA